ncbi:hypothetical protein M1N21_02920 [Dehalococcoidia bacterium]|nr:hypothetical protein [Dehalococcoidia bacterium]
MRPYQLPYTLHRCGQKPLVIDFKNDRSLKTKIGYGNKEGFKIEHSPANWERGEPRKMDYCLISELKTFE